MVSEKPKLLFTMSQYNFFFTDKYSQQHEITTNYQINYLISDFQLNNYQTKKLTPYKTRLMIKEASTFDEKKNLHPTPT